MYEPKLVLISVLVKLGVAAAVSSALARSRVFQRLLFAEHRSRTQLLALVAFICIPLTLGVWVRVSVQNFLAADIAFETVIILGILLGPVAALSGAVLLSAPAMLHREYLTLPFLLVVGIVSALYRQSVDEEEVWSFSPLIDLSIYRWVRRNLPRPRFDPQILLLALIVGMQIVRMWLGRLYPGWIFTLNSPGWAVKVAVCVCPAVVVAIELKIWNASRIELKLEEQKRLLVEARFDALQRQINPHFLFNTLNSIASLVRFRPELAREMIVRLANILRTLLKEHEAYVPFREELGFTDDYLGIEVVRFGEEKLKVVKEIDPQSLEILVPCMLLQPLIENSIKHGLEPRLHGGTVILRSRIEPDKMIVEVEDDGVGMVEGRAPAHGLAERGTGIGMRNVRERLEVLYGSGALFEVLSSPGRGTRVTIEIPLAPSHVALAAQSPARSRTVS
ncbi:MAG TPA: histidine kinase [Acidobacteriaceae bacterium]|nr:histidine kinase [Acidobacteriaceae bacterium]